MRKYRSYSWGERALAIAMCLCMVLSLVIGNDLPELLRIAEKASADEPTATANDYENETLEHMWDANGNGDPTDDDYWKACRPYYACRGGSSAANTFTTFGGVAYRTIFHVFAFEGDTICVGSSVYESQMKLDHSVNTSSPFIEDEGSVDVVMTDLNGVDHPIDIRNSADNKTGYIDSPGTEYAAVKMTCENGVYKGECNIGGTDYTYTPYTYKVQETGVYTFEFHSYNKGYQGSIYTKETTNEVNGVLRSSKFTLADNNDHTDCSGLIAALNLTVFNESGEKQTGRTYADFLSLQMQNANDGVRDTYYILTTDSYIYKMQFNGASPYTYNFFSNNRGITDTSGKIVYKSVKDTFNTNSFDKFKIKFKYPGTKDTETDKSFYIFLEYPDDDLYGHLYEKALLPDPATDIKFVDEVEVNDEDNVGVKKVPGAYVGMGGYFSFKVGEATTATLRLEFKGTTLDGKYAPVEISGPVTPNSTNYFYWDGCDGNGVPIPPGTYSIEDIVFTVTAKAGEIHFPIIDMENAPGGITFTRLSHIYDKKGDQLDQPGSIYDLTKNVIYYDETAIYYGEKVTTVEGAETEANVGGYSDKNKTSGGVTTPNPTYIMDFFAKLTESSVIKYWLYHNMRKEANGGEYLSRNGNTYVSSDGNANNDSKIRVGDHSHTTNIIQYFDETSGDVLTETDQAVIDELDMIKYLNSEVNPVGKSTSSGNANANYGNSTTDYAIANFWTFIPAKPETSKGTSETITIVEKKDNLFNLVGRVFYDANHGGTFDQSSTDGEYLMPEVQLNLYKKTSDTTFDKTKTYVDRTGKELTEADFAGGANAYELVDSEQTTLEGNYVFKGLEYDKANGTEYLYQVVNPNSSYKLTSDTKTANKDVSNGYYNNYACGTTYSGTEIQIIKVGGSDGVDPTKKFNNTSNPSNTVSAVDVGYYYETLDHNVELKKNWMLTNETDHPDSIVFELSYTPKNENKTYVNKYFKLSGINSWKVDNEYLAKFVDGNEVDNYFISAEYYIDDGYIYKHEFEFDNATGKYDSFVGKAYRMTLADLKTKLGATEDITSISNIDLSKLKDLKWGDAISDYDAKYKAVLDRDMKSKTTITVTNSEKPGTIEILKYVDSPEDDKNHLAGATFRVYQGEMSEIQKLVQDNDLAKLTELQVGSNTTRTNGRVAFPGLDPTQTYTVREMFAPDGYRILEEFYEVKGKNATGLGTDEVQFGEDDYALLQIGNALADKEFKIRKRISGRAWQSDDSFNFTIKRTFNTFSDFQIDKDEETLYDNSSMGTEPARLINEFISKFRESKVITINDTKSYYSYTSKVEERPEVTISSTDTKVSDSLIKVDTSASPQTVSFCGVQLTLAGTYTFEITEDDLPDGSTLEKSPRTYKVDLVVRRELNEGVKDTDITLTNSHLVAEVSKITYYDKTGDAEKIFAGTSPLFTNTYVPAPAEQKTSYKIVKNFTGRVWEADDNFTVTINGKDSETQEAIKDEQLVINWSSGTTVTSGETGWTYKFPKPTTGTSAELPFNSFTFKDIEFPVQYVHNTSGKVWDPAEHGGQESPSESEIGDYSPQTRPVTYWLEIKENIPAGATENVLEGITYDSTTYYLEIVLNNTVTGTITPEEEGKEEEDGIIEEIDLYLYKNNISSRDEAVATCVTRQNTMTKAAWESAVASPLPADTTYWYVDNSGLHKSSDYNASTTDAKIFIKKTENHTDKSGTDGHTMKIENKYAASYTWAPQVQKVVKGRDWRNDDVFNFTIALSEDSDKTSVVMPTNTTVEIKNDDTLVPSTDGTCYKDTFGSIVFNKAGTYEFTITETDKNGTKLAEYTITVELTDNGDGTLAATIDGEAIANYVIEFVNEYSGTSFDLNISKTIIGRDWKDGENFKFKITPDSDTLDAIAAGDITMPTGTITQDTSGNFYTTTLSGGGTGSDPFVQKLGEIQLNNTKSLDPTKDLNYKFTISEVTEGLTNMYCRESSYDLFIKVTPATTPGDNSSKNTLSATYAHVITGTTAGSYEAEPTGGITIPFVNVATGNLTVEKKVVSSNEDTTPFNFTVVFTYDEDIVTEDDYRITATKDSKTVEPTSKATDSWTYTFDLADGEKVEFTKIPPNTTYTVTETEKTGYMLLRVRETDEDSGANVPTDSTNSVSGTINSDDSVHRMFVNGKIHNLPSSGGTGISRYVFFGTMLLTTGALILAASHYMKRRQRRTP